MKRYKLINDYYIEKVDDECSYTEETVRLEKGSIWEKEESDFRLLGGDVRLILNQEENSFTWIEVSSETFESNFELIS